MGEGLLVRTPFPAWILSKLTACDTKEPNEILKIIFHAYIKDELLLTSFEKKYSMAYLQNHHTQKLHPARFRLIL